MLILYIWLVTLPAYIAGACGQGMRQEKYGWKKDLIVLFFWLISWYFSIVLVGYVSRNPL
jgi:hypothetical protein